MGLSFAGTVRIGVGVVFTLAFLTLFGVSGAGADVQHGIGFQKGCESPTKVGDPVLCQYLVANNNFTNESLDTVTFDFIADVTHAASGDTPEANIMSNLELFVVSGGATCTAASGTGTFADPWIGATKCSLPGGNVLTGGGSSIASKDHAGYVVQPADFNLPNHQLNDDAKLHWVDTCDKAPTNCNSNQQTQTAPSATTVIRRNSDTATAIHDGQHQVVTTVVVGTTVHDFITVTTADPDPNNPIPHGGDVFLQWFTNGVCDGEGGSVTQTVGPVDATGHFDATGFPQTPTVPGHYSFRAAYLGDGTYGPSTGGCEPLTVVDAKIAIAPNATNEVGQPHTFTVTLQKNAGDGLGFVAAGSEHVSVTLTDSNGATHSAPTGSCTTAGANTNASGQCTITFTSNASGKVTGHASATLSVAGSAPFTRQTDGQAGNSGDAVKTFVDANIQITPNGTNPVGATHTFTGHVNINTGDGAGFVNAPNGTQISFTIDSGPGAFTSANPCTVGAGGSCTINLVSNVTGTTVVSAHTTVSVGGVSLTRHTNATGANSGPATKLWADDTVRTDILNALNQVITTAVSGTVVHDNVQVAKAAGTPASVPNPTGSVIFHRYATINCTGTATNQTVALTPGAPSTANSDGFSVTADMSYQAEYLGDANYPAHLGACEPLTVTPLPAPGIAIVKNPKSQTVAVGGTATFSITVTNIGNVTLTDVHVVDPLSPNCNRTKADIPALASMAPQAAVTYSCTRPNVRSAFNNVATAIGTPPTGPDVTASDTAPVKTKALVPKKIVKKPKIVSHKKPKATG